MADPVKTAEFEGFKKLVSARFSCKRFKSDPIAPHVVKALIDVTRRAPSSFNTQPYRIILVQDKEQRARLAACMSGKNAPACLQAPLVAVFCADTEITRENHRLQNLLRSGGSVPGPYVNIIPRCVLSRGTTVILRK